MAALDSERRVLEDERQQLVEAIAAQSLVFSQGEQLKDGFSLVTGTLYQDVAARAGLVRSFCWVVIDQPGLDPRVGLATLHGDGWIEPLNVGPADRGVLGLSVSDVDAARAACPFPRVS
jgi:hypothetical protein